MKQMARHDNTNWALPELTTWDTVKVAVLMDIRDELQQLNRLLRCPNFINIPSKLDCISRNTAKPRKAKLSRKAKPSRRPDK